MLFALVLVIPGRLVAKFLNSYFTFTPVLALVSINCKSSKPYSLAKLTPSSLLTYLFSSSSSLFPTMTIFTSSPRCVFASYIHLGTLSYDYREVISYVTTATEESYMYWGIKQWNFSYPAVSHIYILTILSSTYIVFVKKSIPTVAFCLPSYVSCEKRRISEVFPTV